MIQINAREVAAEALLQILEEGAYNHMALRKLLRQNGALSQKDRAFVTQIVNGTLRNIYYIDYVINAYSKTHTEKFKPWILSVMRTAVYQMLFLQVPDTAACNEAVKLTIARGYRTLSGFVNGVLRTVARNKQNIILPPKGSADYLSIRYSHPLWLVKMWISYYGYEQTQSLCQADNDSPDVTIRVNTTKTTVSALEHELLQQQIMVTKGKYVDTALHLQHTANLQNISAFTQGLFHVQDESSQIAVAILSPQKGETILDLCAAPGGKSFTMAEQIQNVGNIVSCDIYPHKTELMTQGATRLGLDCISVQVQDATQYHSEHTEKYDKVLIDVPCSGLGLLRKKPDIRLKKDGSEIDALIPIQREILSQAAQYVKKGGTLVYSTCTLSRKENEKNIAWFLEQFPEFTTDDLTPYIPNIVSETAQTGMITLFPHIHHTDGFFIARMKKGESPCQKQMSNQ